MNTETVEKYTLKSKDKPLLHFELHVTRENSGIAGTDTETYRIHITGRHEENKAIFPKNLPFDAGDRDLLRWINHRKAPKNRQFIEQILNTIDDSPNPLKYVDVTYGLSLNDAYWITNDRWSQTWKDCNLYDHPFDERLAQIAFTGYSTKITGAVTSPELTSSGAMKKCWKRRGNEIYLMKGETPFFEDGRTQAINEFYAAQVAEAMGLPHIHYDLEEFHYRNGRKEIVCTCDLFTSEKEGYCTAADFFINKQILPPNTEEWDTLLSTSRFQQKLATAYGQKEYADMMIYDAVICNKDRHLGNFGYMVNNDTGEFLRPAPLFDNGFSLLYTAAPRDLSHVEEFLKDPAGKMGCYLPFDAAARIFVEKRHMAMTRKLLDFKFEKHPNYNVSDQALHAMEKMIHLRASRIMEIYRQKQRMQSMDFSR